MKKVIDTLNLEIRGSIAKLEPNAEKFYQEQRDEMMRKFNTEMKKFKKA